MPRNACSIASINPGNRTPCVAAPAFPPTSARSRSRSGFPPERPTPNFAASWNVAPTDPLPVVRYDAKDHQRSLEVMRWGLVPFWAKDIKVGFANINAKAKGIENKPALREAFQRRRCLVPVDSFYEWDQASRAWGIREGALLCSRRRQRVLAVMMMFPDRSLV
jgi:putative SOS response-associated peptidase YedK